jgi:exodeoxyribonuclease VII small subunit
MKKKIKFEDALKKLENVVEKLENEENDLDEILNLYREGADLAEYCHNKIVNVENEIEIISNKLKENKGK